MPNTPTRSRSSTPADSGRGAADDPIAVVRALVEALNDRDLPRYFARTTRDFEIRIHGFDGMPEVVAGRRALDAFFSSFFEQWDELSYEFVEGPELTRGVVSSRDRWTGSGPAREGQVVAQYYAIGAVRGRLCASMDAYLAREGAIRHLERLPE